MIGQALGPYRVLEKLGEGGMGEVWRATDIMLGRQVAIKVLPETFAHDPDRLARFEREARTLASLNHAGIATVYGVEDAGTSRALVMELVEGPTLAETLAQGPMAVDEALAMARQVADALAAAHDQGIVHRDLKPANIKVRPDGVVKVLDFGLAKAMEPAAAALSPGLSQSPTLTSPAMTQAGMILGTAAYMSPEQVKGRPVDKRSDVWAFGCVLFEALTGRRAFDAPDVQETLAAVLTREPDWNLLPARVPAPIRALLRGCLTRDRRHRVGDMAAALFAIDAAGSVEEDAGGPAASATPRGRGSWAAVLLLAAAAAVAGFALGATFWRQPAPPADRVPLVFPGDRIFTNTAHRQVAISPDGREIVYRANSQLYRRPLGSFDSTAIPGNVAWDPLDVIFAPDSRSIAFYSRLEGAVMRSPLTGGTPTMIGRAEPPFGMSWDADSILVAQGPGGILRFRVGDAAGVPEQLVLVEEHEIAAAPQMLPGGDAVLFTLARAASEPTGQWDRARIVVQSLRTGERETVVEGASDARYLPTGHLIYAVAGIVFARPFDPRTRGLGDPVPVVEGVRRAAETGIAHLTVSASGTLLYVPGPTTWIQDLQTLAITDATGGTTPLPLPDRAYDHPRVAGSRVAWGQDDRDIWVYDLAATAAPRRLTLEGRNRFPVWSPDGARIAFQSNREGDLGIWMQDADGRQPATPLTRAEAGDGHIPESWSPDGQTLLFSVQRGARFSLWTLNLADMRSAPFVDVVSSGGPPGAVFSPDGHWIAYSVQAVALTADSANRGIFVRPFPATDVRHQVTRSGLDFHPAWAPDGDTLYYLASVLQPIVAVGVRRESGNFSGSPVSTAAWSRRVYTQTRGYDILPDGRFLTMVPASSNLGSATTPEARVVLNWLEELKEHVPAR
jgi:eukaryotic-like serine/threonine-protein kinase